MNAFNVYLGRKLIDTVFFQLGIDVQYVYDSLVNHDGYDYRIRVTKAR